MSQPVTTDHSLSAERSDPTIEKDPSLEKDSRRDQQQKLADATHDSSNRKDKAISTGKVAGEAHPRTDNSASGRK